MCFFSSRLCFVTTSTFPTSHSHHLLSLSSLYISSWLPAWFLLTMYRSFLHPMATNRALMVSLLPHHKRWSTMKRTCWMIERISPGSSTPVSSTAVSSTPISSTDVLSTLFLQCNNLCRSSLYCLLMYYVKVRGQITKGKTCFATS